MASVSKKQKEELPPYEPSEILIPDSVPDDVVFNQYAFKNGTRTRRPLNNSERKQLQDFYETLRGKKYAIPLKVKLPLRGMLMFIKYMNHWRPTLALSDVIVSKVNPAETACDVLFLDINTPDAQQYRYYLFEESTRLVSQKFLDLFPTSLVEEEIPSRIIRMPKETSSSDEELDYSAVLLTMDDVIVESGFKFPDAEPLFKQFLKGGQSSGPKKLIVEEYWSTAGFKLLVTSARSPSEFYFTNYRQKHLHDEMHQKMRKIYGLDETCKYFIPNDLVKPAMPAVRLHSAEFCYRGYVAEIVDRDICKFYNFDKKCIEEIYKSELRFLHKSLATYPNFCYYGKLADVLPMPGNYWSDEARRAFRDLTVPGRPLLFGVASYFATDGAVALYLCRKGEKGEDIWIGDHLLSRRLARENQVPPNLRAERLLPEKDEQAAFLADLMAKVGITSGSTEPEVASVSSVGGGSGKHAALSQNQSTSRTIQH